MVTLEKFVEENCDYEWIECLQDFTKSETFILNQMVSEESLLYDVPLIKIECLIYLLRKGSEKTKEIITGDRVMINIVDQFCGTLLPQRNTMKKQ